MTLFKDIEPTDNENNIPINENDDLDDLDILNDNEDENEDEDIDELEKIDSRIEKGEDAAISSLEVAAISKTRIIYQCPLSKKIYWNNKWVKDSITDLYTLRTELAYCPKYLEKGFDLFIGSVEIFDKRLSERKDSIIALAKRAESELEDREPFEIIINIKEKNNILFVFTNTTRLAFEIGKVLRQEYQGGVQYEWFERNQYLRVKWYDTFENKDDFKKLIKSLKDKRYGMFSFEEEI
jgi:hypothetical protein